MLYNAYNCICEYTKYTDEYIFCFRRQHILQLKNLAKVLLLGGAGERSLWDRDPHGSS